MGTPIPSDDLLLRYDVNGPRYTSYPPVPAWSRNFGEADYLEKLEAAGRAEGSLPLSLYVHIPFCEKLCTYCGCNVVITRNTRRADEYLGRVDREMEIVAGRLGKGRSVSQVHWGGGTPNFLDESQLERLWRSITDRFLLLPDAEVSVEINPATARTSQVTLLRQLGFKRVSMGVQDFDPLVQKTVHRVQTPQETEVLMEAARAAGYEGVNLDLIYGLPHQAPESWRRTLEEVIRLQPDRIALFSLAYMPQAIRHQRALPKEVMPETRKKLELFRLAKEALLVAGYCQVGMDHFARPTDELVRAQRDRRLGRNFQGYTVKSTPDLVAFGSSGISDVAGAYAQNVKPLDEYNRLLDAGRLPVERGLLLSADDLRRRRVITQLMCHFFLEFDPDDARYFSNEVERLRPLEADGLLRLSGHQVEVTDLGRFFIRNIAMVFDAHLAELPAGMTYSRTV